jgi:hypothetical protein
MTSYFPGGVPFRRAGLCESQAGWLRGCVSGQSASSSLAITAPDEGSLIIPGFTNRQTGRVVGAASYLLQNPPIIPVYHWTGGEFASGVPTALPWTRERFFFDALMQASPYQRIGEQVDTERRVRRGALRTFVTQVAFILPRPPR